jgi:hypothetical protein
LSASKPQQQTMLSPKEPNDTTNGATRAKQTLALATNKHPVEFSNNQHTPSTNPPNMGSHQGQLPYFTRGPQAVKTPVSGSWLLEVDAQTERTVSGDLDGGESPADRPARSWTPARPAPAGFVTLPGRLRDRKSGLPPSIAPPEHLTRHTGQQPANREPGEPYGLQHANVKSGTMAV